MRISITNPNVISIAKREFQKGSIIVFPTDTSYGLGTVGLKWNDRNIKRIYEIKSRELDNPLSLLITKTMISKYIKISSGIQKLLMKVWPGELTAVLNCDSRASQTLSSFLNKNNPQKIAFRVPNHNLLLKIIKKVNSPIIGTSANRSGSKPKYDLLSIFQELPQEEINLWIDSGRLPQNPPSTVVDLTDPLNPILLRRGRVDIEKILGSSM
ncbi:MAG: threonylcarbamoyl-AMP synthase [Candidatus Heimdallarchaeota archaeon]|nr:MAG: threonylcarbamoyl-AMP synthase [Candidatus Heimdallarchaeota archaeon]